MSSSYTFHVPAQGAAGDAAMLDRAEVVRDGFSWGACLAPCLYFLWHRHWLPALFALVAVGGLALALSAAGMRPGAIGTAEILLHLLFGFEGATLRRLDYAWRRRPLQDVVIASDDAEAEAKAFARWLAAPRATASETGSRATPQPWPSHAAGQPIIGLFPDREGRRP